MDDKLIEMANESGSFMLTQHGVASAKLEWFREFAKRVAAQEREECARMVEPVDASLADEIRARGEK